ncbi:hypothetical protein LJ656_14060 [Paraburkholderia sp. MMS20-SJTR3]|uniref:Uncharacterized protein n=1 Tax=Paraburkholderia sejongensis TaxID=2886946 RepID=A0ABS8JUZ4_9BURK|nr:hypothetical protein [Paraburkholderia sp. MMS20-SJTR3]MCC8393716.1 hypothetical protein [Paraburkholderia sp. MMS20-SJTR3]
MEGHIVSAGIIPIFFADVAPRNAHNASPAAIPTGASIPGNVESHCNYSFCRVSKTNFEYSITNNEVYIPIKMTIKTIQNLYRPSQREIAGPNMPPKTALQNPSSIVRFSEHFEAIEQRLGRLYLRPAPELIY